MSESTPITSLSDAAAAIAPEEEEIHEIDVSSFLSGGRQLVLKWKEPDVSQMYQIAIDAALLLDRFPDWGDRVTKIGAQEVAGAGLQLAQDVATMAQCHVAPDPGGTPPGLFYAGMISGARPNKKMFLYLSVRMKELFPILRSDLRADTLKNILCGPAPSTAAADTRSNAEDSLPV